MPGIFPTGRRDDRSLMSSLIAWRVPSYESRKQSLARAHAHTASMNTRKAVMNYTSSQPKNLGPRVPHHMIQVYIILRGGSIPPQPFDTNTRGIECNMTYSITCCTLESRTDILLRIAHTMDINILTQSKQNHEVLLCLHKAVWALFLDTHLDFHTSGLYMLSLTFVFFFSFLQGETENKPSEREAEPQ